LEESCFRAQIQLLDLVLTITLLLGVFFSALASGWHCALMCGGIVSKSHLSVIRFSSRRDVFVEHLLMHFGRITSYVILGGLAGRLGALLWWQELFPIQRVLFFIASTVLLINGIKTIWPLSLKLPKMTWLIPIEKKLALSWSNLFKAMPLQFESIYLQKMFFGLAWGLVPCGLVYSVLGLSFLSGSGWQGALLMMAMGLGTLPNLFIISGGFGKLSAWLAQMGSTKLLKLLTAGLFFTSALFGFYQTFTLSSQMIKNGFCFN